MKAKVPVLKKGRWYRLASFHVVELYPVALWEHVTRLIQVLTEPDWDYLCAARVAESGRTVDCIPYPTHTRKPGWGIAIREGDQKVGGFRFFPTCQKLAPRQVLAYTPHPALPPPDTSSFIARRLEWLRVKLSAS